MTRVSYTKARNNLAHLLDVVTQNCEVVTITRQGSSNVCMIAESELKRLLEIINHAQMMTQTSTT